MCYRLFVINTPDFLKEKDNKFDPLSSYHRIYTDKPKTIEEFIEEQPKYGPIKYTSSTSGV